MRIILASNSPRRKELLGKLISDFEVRPSNFDEESIKLEKLRPSELVEILSKGKGEDVYSKINTKEDFVVISSDTMVFCKDKLLGKPKDKKEAFEMIKMLQNNMHTVYTGMYVVIKIGSDEKRVLTHSKTDVYFKKLADKEILNYINTENILDKAGAYAIQGNAKDFVKKIDGNISTVIGLDIEKLKNIFEEYEII